jgi:hypothetical protein
MMFIPHRKHTYIPPCPVMGIALLYIIFKVKEKSDLL